MEIEKAVAQEEKKPATFLNLVHIALDNYDDIFSDFDPSPYSSRILSDDFLKEVQRRYIETKRGQFEIRFSLPKALRSAKTEALIKKRLKDYFEMQLKAVDEELRKRRRKGGLYVALGLIFLGSEVFLAGYAGSYTPIIKILEILLVPAGWYGMFVGIENLIEVPQKLEDQRRFYDKFKNATYLFISEEDIVQQIEETAAKAETPKPAEQPKAGEKKQA